MCDRLPLLPLLTTTYMGGIIIATLVLGTLAGLIWGEIKGTRSRARPLTSIINMHLILGQDVWFD